MSRCERYSTCRATGKAGNGNGKFASLLLLSSLVPSLSAPQIFIAYGMKNRGRKSGRKRHDDACLNVRHDDACLTSQI